MRIVFSDELDFPCTSVTQFKILFSLIHDRGNVVLQENTNELTKLFPEKKLVRNY